MSSIKPQFESFYNRFSKKSCRSSSVSSSDRSSVPESCFDTSDTVSSCSSIASIPAGNKRNLVAARPSFVPDSMVEGTDNGEIAASDTAAEQFLQYRDPVIEASESAPSAREHGSPGPARPLNSQTGMPQEPSLPYGTVPTAFYQMPNPAGYVPPSMRNMLPGPNALDAPHFEKENASEFLRSFEDTCRRTGDEDFAHRMCLLPQYCSKSVRVWVEKQPTWKARDWEGFKTEFLSYYYLDDLEQQRYEKDYLYRLAEIDHETTREIQDYLEEFDEVSAVITNDSLLADTERSSIFRKGLPERLQSKIVRQHAKRGRRSPRDYIKYSEAYNVVYQYLYAEEEVRKNVIRKNSEKERNSYRTDPRPPMQPQSSSNAATYQNSSSTDQMLREMQGQMEALTLKLNASTDMRNNPSYEQNRQNPSNGLNINPPLRCWTCSGPHVSRPHACPTLRDLIMKGMVHQNSDQKLQLGTIEEPGPLLRVHPSVLRQDSIKEQYAEWKRSGNQHSAPSNLVYAPPQHVRAEYKASLNGVPGVPVSNLEATLIGSSPDWSKLSEDEEEYEEDLYRGAVNAVESRSQKRQRNNDIARTRNTNNGRFQPRVEEVMEDDDAMQDRPPESSQSQTQRQQESRVEPGIPAGNGHVTIPRRVRGPTDRATAERRSKLSDLVLKKIWDTNITISIGELLGSAPRLRAGVGKDVSVEAINQRLREVFHQVETNSTATSLPEDLENQLEGVIKDIRKHYAQFGPTADENDAFTYNSNVNYSGVQFDAPLFGKTAREYTRGLLYVAVMVGGQQVRACIDQGSSANIIRHSIVERMDNPQLRLKPRLTLTPVDGGSLGVFGCIDSLPINIGDIVTESHTMISEKCTNDILLGRLWAKDALLQTSEKPDGSVACKVFNRDRTKFTTFEAYHPREGGSLYEHQLFPNESGDAFYLKAEQGV